MLSRPGLCLALVTSVGIAACVSLDKPAKVATCAALNNCTNDGSGAAPAQTGGSAGAGGTAGSASGGAAGATTTSGAGGAIGTGGIGGAASGGVATDGPSDVASGGAGGGGGAGGDAGGTAPTGGASGAGGAKTGGAGGSGVDGGGGRTSTGGTIPAGGTNGSGGATARDAGPEAGPDASTLLAGLVVYYTFESASGTDLPDQSGKNNNGKLSGSSGTAYELVTGKVGKALSLHKAGPGYVTVPTAVFASATDITIAAWVNVTTSQNWQRLIDVGIDAKAANNSQTGTKYLNIVPKNDGSNLLFSITTNGYTNEQKLSATNLSVGTWTHVAVVLSSGGAGGLYINGSEAATSTSLSLRPTDLGAIDYAFIGKSQFTNDPAFDGIVDEFRVYNRALSASEVQALSTFTGP